MPIRFRCAYCNQLMGISRRKAGTIVRCPKCSGQVVVPNPDDQPAGDDPMGPGSAAKALEDADLENLLTGAAKIPEPAAPLPVSQPAPRIPPAPVPAGESSPFPQPLPAIDVEPLEPMALPSPSPPSSSPALAPGMVAVPRMLLIGLATVLMLLLGLAFLIGFLIGKRSTRAAPVVASLCAPVGSLLAMRPSGEG